MSQADEVPQPPKPPEVGRKFHPKINQVVGVSLLAILVLLALLGVFGLTSAASSSQDDAVSLDVSYPSRLRYKTIGTIDVTVSNNAERQLETVTAIFDRSYVDRFSTVSFTPSVSKVTPDSYEVELKNVAAGESRLISVELQGEQYWQAEGAVSVESSAGSPSVRLSTITFP